ncbi:MAG: hypothetical protein Q9209_001931 [Squamulea sp. 1 TL-2023]
MSDLGERLKRLLAPQTPDGELDRYEASIAKQYRKAYKAFYHRNNRTKCASKILQIMTTINKEARTQDLWQSYILCKTYLLGSIFEARPKALDNVDKIRQHLSTFTPDAGKTGSSNFEKDYPEIQALRDELEKRLIQERSPEFVKETWWFHSTTSWPVRMTDEWLEQTASQSG